MTPLACRVLGQNDESWMTGCVLAFLSTGVAVVWYGPDLAMKLVPLDRIRVTTNEICASLPRHEGPALWERINMPKSP